MWKPCLVHIIAKSVRRKWSYISLQIHYFTVTDYVLLTLLSPCSLCIVYTLHMA